MSSRLLCLREISEIGSLSGLGKPPLLASCRDQKPMPQPAEPAERLEARRVASRRASDLPLVWVAIATAAGLLFQQMLYPKALTPIVLLVPIPLLLVCWAIAWRKMKNEKAAWILVTSIALLAASWSGLGWRTYATDDIGRYAARDAEPICLEGIVTTAPTFYPAEASTPFHAIPPTDRSILKIEVTRIRNGQTWCESSGRCEVRLAGKANSLRTGTHAQLFGQLRRPTMALNPGQRDSARAKRANRCSAILWCESPACATALPSQETSAGFQLGWLPSDWLPSDWIPSDWIPSDWIQANWLSKLRRKANETLNHHLSERNAPIASAMLLGNPSGLTPSTTDAFRKTGTLHVLVVSGLHVGLVASLPLLLGMVGLLPMRIAQVTSLLLVIFYAGLVGSRPPALRAAILAGGAVVAALVRRQPLGMNSLGGAAVTLFATSPGAFEAAGTKLSFLAAASLLGFGTLIASRSRIPKPPLERLIDRTRTFSNKAVRSFTHWCVLIVLATLVVLIVTGPLIATEFHLVSPSALLLAIPLMLSVAVVIPSGLLLMLLEEITTFLPDAISRCLTWLPAKLCDLGISFLNELVHLTSELWFSSFYTAGPARWWVATWYLLLGLSAMIEYTTPKLRGLSLRLGLALVAAAFVPSLVNFVTQQNQLRVSAIAVGHGSSMLIETPGGEVILYDAGSLGSPGRATEIISRALWSRGIHQIDAVILSHADVDHYNALPGLIERFSIGQIWTSHLMFDPWEAHAPHSGPMKLQELLDERTIPILEFALGDVIRLGQGEKKITLEVLHPSELGVLGSDNANSLVLGLEYQGKRLVMTGDVETAGLEHLLATELYPCDLLVAPHHGSERSNPPGLVEWCHPKRVLISSGNHHPTTEAAYASSGAELMNTHEVGMITTLIDSTGVRWRGHLPRR